MQMKMIIVLSPIVYIPSDSSSSEKTTSYRRTSSGGGTQGKCGKLSPTSVGSQEELYCSLVGNSPGLTPAPAPAPAQSSSPSQTSGPRPRRNAMVHSLSIFLHLYSVYYLLSALSGGTPEIQSHVSCRFLAAGLIRSGSWL